VIITKDILTNQLRRDAPKIAVTFDEALKGDLDRVSEMVACTVAILSPRIVGRDLNDDTRGATCARLLNTALTTFIGCVYLARGGFRLQYMTLSRSVVETICTVMHLMIVPDAIREFHSGTFRSTRSIGIANKAMPWFGKMYGYLSDQFVHINPMHSGLNSLAPYKQGDDDLSVIQSNMRMLSWLIFVAAELVFVEETPQPRYWKIISQSDAGNAVTFSPSDDERAWQASFLGVGLEAKE
jgi:hypothetical protein